jgi:hypothetical protein
MMGETLTTYAVAIAGIVILSVVWIGVQNCWRRTFPEAFTDSSDPDVLAGRMGCHGCQENTGHCHETAAGTESSSCPRTPTTEETTRIHSIHEYASLSDSTKPSARRSTTEEKS